MKRRPKANTSKIEKLLDYISALSKQLRESYRILSDTEIGGMMQNILLGMRRLENEILDIERKQQRTLLNVLTFDIDDVKNEVSHCMVDIENSQMFDVNNKTEEVDENWQEAISIENQSAPFTLGDDYSEYTDTRLFLMKNIRPNYFKLVDSVETIKAHLDSLAEQIDGIMYSSRVRSMIYNKMFNDYQKNEWGQDYASFIYQTKNAVEEGIKHGIDVVATLKNELGALTSQNYNTFMSPAIRAVFKTVTSPRLSPAEAIAKKRMKLVEDDISSFFSYYFRYSLLKNHLDSLPLLQPVDGVYSQLFVNRAAKEYVDILQPFLWTSGIIKKKGHIGILLLAMYDLGLTQKVYTKNKELFPNIPMMHYANEMNTYNAKLKIDGQSIISKITGAIGLTPFCELEYGDVGDSKFEPNKIREFQNVYALCFALLNHANLVMPEEKKVALYILEQQKSLHLTGNPQRLEDSLKFLCSVIRRETLLFDGIE